MFETLSWLAAALAAGSGWLVLVIGIALFVAVCRDDGRKHG